MLYAQFVALAAIFCIAAITAMGCGKSSSQTTTSAESATTAAKEPTTTSSTTHQAKQVARTELLARANAACARIKARLNQNKAQSAQEIATVATSLATYERAVVAELQTLVPPASLESDWRIILTGLRYLPTDAQKIGEYARANRLETPAGHALLVATGKHGLSAIPIAERDGLTECAKAI